MNEIQIASTHQDLIGTVNQMYVRLFKSLVFFSFRNMKLSTKMYVITGLCTVAMILSSSRQIFMNLEYHLQHVSTQDVLWYSFPYTARKSKIELPLLTMFTAFKDHPNNTHHQFAHRLAISNWASFIPLVKPVLFTENNDSELVKLARNSEWDVLPLTRVNPSGAPFLKDMFETVFEKYNSTFYGFANGDLLFDDSLTDTLYETKRNLEHLQNNVLIVGIRTNVALNNTENATQEFSRENLQSLARERGKLYITMSEDYFFFTRDHCSLNWSSLADVVIGRVAYDNYLVAMAIDQKVNTIDATKTVLSLHISNSNVSETGRRNVDNDFNYYVIGPFHWGRGLTTSTKYVTLFDFMNRTVLFKGD